MPGFELFGDKEKAEVQKVLDTGVLMRYGYHAYFYICSKF